MELYVPLDFEFSASTNSTTPARSESMTYESFFRCMKLCHFLCHLIFSISLA